MEQTFKKVFLKPQGDKKTQRDIGRSTSTLDVIDVTQQEAYSAKGKGREQGSFQHNFLQRDLHEHYRPERSLLDDFHVTGGNIPIEKANIICLGERHDCQNHVTLHARLLESFAKDGDIVLVEGVKSGQVVSRHKLEVTKTLTKDVTVYGWDNIDLVTEAMRLSREGVKLDDRLDSSDLSTMERATLRQMHKTLMGKYTAIAQGERNKVLARTISTMRQIYPEKRIFIIAGYRHFIVDADFQRFLAKDKYIAFTPQESISDPERTRNWE
jgi:hypothetical protein